MFLLKIIFLTLVVTIVSILLFKYLNNWATNLRHYMLNQARNVFGNGAGWDRPWSLIISKTLIIWFAFMFIVLVFNLCFGTIYSNCDLTCQADWQAQ
jgi:hypothetical protein